jgi:hypothetical protein
MFREKILEEFEKMFCQIVKCISFLIMGSNEHIQIRLKTVWKFHKDA